MSAAEVAYRVYRFVPRRSQSARFRIFFLHVFLCLRLRTEDSLRIRAYRVFEFLSIVLNLRPIRVVEEARVFGALKKMARTGVDVDDAFLALLTREHAGAVASFDRDFEKLGVAWVEP